MTKEENGNAETYPGEPVLVWIALLELGRSTGRCMQLYFGRPEFAVFV